MPRQQQVDHATAAVRTWLHANSVCRPALQPRVRAGHEGAKGVGHWLGFSAGCSAAATSSSVHSLNALRTQPDVQLRGGGLGCCLLHLLHLWCTYARSMLVSSSSSSRRRRRRRGGGGI
jgi:hypothetical protein